MVIGGRNHPTVSLPARIAADWGELRGIKSKRLKMHFDNLAEDPSGGAGCAACISEPEKKCKRKALTNEQRARKRESDKRYRDRHRDQRNAKAIAYYRANKQAFRERNRKNRRAKPWLKDWETDRYYERLAHRLATPIVTPLEMLSVRAELAKGDLYERIRRTVPKWLSPDHRDEVVGDVVVALLEGCIPANDLARFVKFHAELHMHRNYPRGYERKFFSLDEQRFLDSPRTRLDDLTYLDVRWN